MQTFLRKTYRVFLCSIFILCFLVTQSSADQNNPLLKNGENNFSILAGNQTRHYLLYLPVGYDQKVPLPLVFFFHGTGGKPKMGMAVTDFGKVADKNKFAIVAPEGVFLFMGMNSWNADLDPAGVNDVGFVSDLIKEVSSKVVIDKKRIYATGFSAGARISSRLACEIPNVIAAIGAVAGLQYPQNCAKAHPVSIIAFHGGADRLRSISVVEPAVSKWVEHNGCNNSPIERKISENAIQTSYGGCKGSAEVTYFRINDGGHTWPGSPMPELFEKAGSGRTNKDISATNLIWSFFETHSLP